MASEQVFSSGKRSVMLIELFTSQGCSSCPPAEAWLSDLKNAPGLWEDMVPLAFHVDYWNDLGWKDTWSDPAHSARQARYRADGNIRTVYTPGFVVNGREWRNWFYQRRLPRTKGVAGKLSVHLKDRRISAFYQAPHGHAGLLQLNVALLAMGVNSEIRAGENQGKSLSEDFVVLSHNRTVSRNGHWKTQLPTYQIPTHRRLALAAWVDRLTDQTPLQATGGWIIIE